MAIIGFNDLRLKVSGYCGALLSSHMQRSIRSCIMVTSIAVLALCSMMAYARDPIEKEKIQYLISSVEKLKGAKFIRNGSEHDGKEAANHLRMKLQKAGKKVQTADDFVRLCASKSYVSGKPYMIRFSDGKTITSEDYFRKKLREFKPGAK